MRLDIVDTKLVSGMQKEELPGIIANNSVITCLNSNENNYIYRCKQPIKINDARFRVTIMFKNNVLKKVTLVAVSNQESNIYSNISNAKDLHEKWLINTYGKPHNIELYGYSYKFEDGEIASEYDPRSGSNEIIYVFN